MNRLPPAARVFHALVIAAGVAVCLVVLPRVEFAEPVVLAALLLLAAATSTFDLPVGRGPATIPPSIGVAFTGLLLCGPYDGLLVALMSGFSRSTLAARERAAPYRVLFATASIALVFETAASVFFGLGGRFGTVGTPAGPMAAAALTFVLLDFAVTATATALSSREPRRIGWLGAASWSAAGGLVSLSLGVLAASLIRQTVFVFVPLIFVPLYLTYRSYRLHLTRIEHDQRREQQTATVHLATIEALARAIDAKDQSTFTRIWRVQLYAARLARAIGLGEREVEGVRTAALLQDIGKLAVPEHILSKPGPLTKQELEKVRSHPELGAEIIAGVPFPYPVAPTILSHHEHWNGTGYPQGLRGEAIPLGARILTIVDYFDAVTTDRPYRKAFGVDEAIDLLKREAGAALDPRLVKTFIGLLPALLAENAAYEQRARAQSEARAAGAGVLEPLLNAPQSAFENIALAHREVFALYEIAQPMSASLSAADTMANMSSKLAKIVPWSACTLFLRDPKTQTLRCSFAVGLDVPALLNRTLSEGLDLDGWIVRTRRALVNSNPRAIFESAGLDGTTELKSALMCPLVFNDTVIGVLTVYHVEPDRYTEGHRRLLERVAEQAGVVLHNSLVFEKTQEEALTDALTGLSNRRAIVVHLSQELARAERLQSKVALILLDIDQFKSINDNHGHNTGDRALCEVAATLQSVLRPYDLCARYGGDEFVLVLPNCTRESAEARCADLQQRISRVQLEIWPDTTVTLGASAGVSIFPDDGTTHDMLVGEADRRMYRNKASRKQAVPARRSAASVAGASVQAQPERAAPGAGKA
jgi:diguanylate cyclase (GGDEF)-like protein/putative nucleotidyltransferase with HDIG domain